VLKKRKSLLINGFGLSERLISESPVGLDAEMIRKYVKFQEKKEKVIEERDLFNK